LHQIKKSHAGTNGHSGIHLAIFNEPFCSLLLSGQKKVESRFSVNRISPFGKVNSGDVIFVKESAGPIVGYFIASFTDYIQINSIADLRKIEEKYGAQICSDANKTFWQDRKETKYASLIGVEGVRTICPIEIQKRDRLSWVVIKQSTNSLPFDTY
jgi:hypothetical protein